MLVDLNGLSDPSWVPCLDGSDKFCSLPVYSVVGDVGVLADG